MRLRDSPRSLPYAMHAQKIGDDFSLLQSKLGIRPDSICLSNGFVLLLLFLLLHLFLFCFSIDVRQNQDHSDEIKRNQLFKASEASSRLNTGSGKSLEIPERRNTLS